MGSLRDFLEAQERIYNKFRNNSKVKEEGTKPSSFIDKPLGGYIVALRHPFEVTDKVEDFALKVSHVVPALVYDEVNAHTSLATYKIGENFSPDSMVMADLAQAVYGVSLEGTILKYNEWAYNQDKVMVLGQPNKHFVNVMDAIAREASKKCIDLKIPPMSHISANAFTKKCVPDELVEFFALMKHVPIIGESLPIAVDVGYFIASKSGFHLQTYERFSVKDVR